MAGQPTVKAENGGAGPILGHPKPGGAPLVFAARPNRGGHLYLSEQGGRGVGGGLTLLTRCTECGRWHPCDVTLQHKG